jgi:thymidine kinase
MSGPPYPITLVHGPMFSGKTSYAITRAQRWRAVGHPVLYVTHAIDERGFGTRAAVSHAGAEIDPRRSAADAGPLYTEERRTDDLTALAVELAARPAAERPRLVIVDEAQFYKGLVAGVCALARVAGVLVCGLDFDAEGRPFGETLAVPATERIALRALCAECEEPVLAPFTARLGASRGADDAVAVGGADAYRAVCARHHSMFA